MEKRNECLCDLSDLEMEFVEEYRGTDEYRRAMLAWELRRTWRISYQREPPTAASCSSSSS
jgi:hypothetical protein